MGEEKKEEEENKGGGGGGEEKKEEEIEIVLKVEMHCEACARKVARSLRGFQGVEDVTADYKASKVVVKGKAADPIKVTQRIQKKSGKKVEIISPNLPKPPQPQEEIKEPQEEKKEEPPAAITVVLKVGIHCDACAQSLQKRIRKIQGVESVTTDVANGQVMVKGIVDPTKLVNDVYKKTRKQASIVKPADEQQNKQEDNNVQQQEEKKEEEKGKGKGKGEEEVLLHDDDDEKMKMMMRMMHMMEIKKGTADHEHWPSKYYYYADHSAANYPPQMFSDENPHACSLM